MAFCTQCGQPIPTGGTHVCDEVAASRMELTDAGSTSGGIPQAIKQMNSALLLDLLRNPLLGLRLGSGDLVYGLVGIVSSWLGFLIWSWLVQKKIESVLGGLFGGFGLFSGLQDAVETSITGKLLLMGLLSIATLLVSLWLIGNWKGSRSLSFTDTVTRLGAVQLASGVGFVVSGILVFMSIKLSLLLLTITLLSSLLLSVMGAMELFRVSEDRRVVMVSLAISAYLVIISFLASGFIF